MRAFVLGQQVGLSDTLSHNYFSGAQIFIMLSQLPPPALQAQPVAEMRRADLLRWRKPPWKKAREQPSQWHVGGNAALALLAHPWFQCPGLPQGERRTWHRDRSTQSSQCLKNTARASPLPASHRRLFQALLPRPTEQTLRLCSCVENAPEKTDTRQSSWPNGHVLLFNYGKTKTATQQRHNNDDLSPHKNSWHKGQAGLILCPINLILSSEAAPCTAGGKTTSYEKSSLGTVYHCTTNSRWKSVGRFLFSLRPVTEQHSAAEGRGEQHKGADKAIGSTSGSSPVNSCVLSAHHWKANHFSRVTAVCYCAAYELSLLAVFEGAFPCGRADTQCFGMKKTVW